MEARVKWEGGMKFRGEAQSGHQVLMDAAEQGGGKNEAPRPTELVLMGLGGCTGMDVVSILEKMRIPFDSFQVDIEGDRAEDHPKVFTEIRMNYRIWGKEIPREKFERAVTLSQERYCTVSNMLNKTARITYQLEINGEKV